MSGSNADDRSYSGDITLSVLGPFVGQYGGTIEWMVARHHGLSLSPYAVSVEAADPVGVPMPGGTTRFATNHVHGFGGELAYRYFWGDTGPHGLFVSPALIVGSLDLDTPRTGDSTSFTKIGGALDVGYQAIVEHVVIALAFGAQYAQPSKAIAAQNPNVDVQTDAKVHPRALFALGYAF